MTGNMKRQAWLDYLKLIAMFLVVVYHTPPRFDTAHEVALFNMGAPVFFLAAGYLFNIAKLKGFLSFLRHRASRILVPYATFFVVFYALWLVVGRRMAGPEEQAIDVLTPLWQFVQGTPDVVLGPFWFLACIFTMQVIYYPISKYLSGYWPLLVSLLLSLSLFVLPDVPCLRPTFSLLMVVAQRLFGFILTRWSLAKPPHACYASPMPRERQEASTHR